MVQGLWCWVASLEGFGFWVGIGVSSWFIIGRYMAKGSLVLLRGGGGGGGGGTFPNQSHDDS